MPGQRRADPAYPVQIFILITEKALAVRPITGNRRVAEDKHDSNQEAAAQATDRNLQPTSSIPRTGSPSRRRAASKFELPRKNAGRSV